MAEQSAPKRRPWFSGDWFEQVVTILMTLVLIQTAVVTYWFTLTDDSQGDAGRDAQIVAIQGLGRRTAGSIQTGAYQRWVELNTLARLSEQEGDSEAAGRYVAARDRVAGLSPLLQPPYFDPDTETLPDVAAYEADTFVVETTELAERFANQYNLKVAWFNKANAFMVHLTLLAVTLFLLGLSTTAKSGVRWVFVGVALFLAMVTLVWMLATQFQPVSGLSNEAIQAYSRGLGLAYQGKSKEAIASFDKALKAAPAYANAFRGRAEAHYELGDREAAASDFLKAREAGDKSSETTGNLAWTYYTLGRFDESIAMNRIALKTSPDEMWIKFNLALSLLASGQVDAAMAEYADGMNMTARQVAQARAANKEPPATLWWAIDAGASDLDALMDCLVNRQCRGAPPYTAIKATGQVKRAADDLRVRLKELAVALEYTGKPPAGTVSAVIQPFKFAEDVSETGEIHASTVFTPTDSPLYVIFDYEGLQDGHLIVIKVYVDGEEDPRLRVAEEFDASQMGSSGEQAFFLLSSGGLPLPFGNYQVEMFVNSRLVQTGRFIVKEEQDPQSP